MSNYDTSIRRYAEQQSTDYIEICNCENAQRILKFDINLKKYFSDCGCDKEFPCAKLQINKHKLVINSKKRRLLDPYFTEAKKEPKIMKNPSDQTLDKFFAE
ncbi:MAG: hypothetical protein FK734_13930 [Asgard group archaeon]|nr:hypothetical protein [Asgard group archaeon]